MKRKTITHAARLLCVLALAMTMTTAAFAADPPEPAQPNGAPVKSETLWGEEEQGSGANSARQGGVSRADFATTSYPTAVTRSEDGGEIRKMYDLGPEDDPAGIPRSDFEQEGYHYTLTDLLKQELPANESRQHTETVSVPSQSKDMGAVLALLPQTKEFITEDGLAGTLALKLDTVNVEVAGYGSSTKSVTASRTYPGLADQDTQYIPKSITDNGHSLTLQTVNWQTEGDGHFTAVASYSGSATSSYVKGYTVTADYAGTVSRINLNKIRYVAIFEGTALEPVTPEEPGDTPSPDLNDPADPTAPAEPTNPTDNPTVEKNNVLPMVAVVAVVLLGGGAFYFIKRRR